MKSNTRISVLMPVYNAERYVAEAVESILAQTFTDFEFLIVDDGSTDGSLPILQSYAEKDQRIKLKSRENLGLVATLNEMLADAQGEFLARMDADDASLPQRFEKQMTAFKADDRLVAVGSQVTLIDPDGDLLQDMQVPTAPADVEQSMVTGTGSSIVHPSAMLRRAALASIGNAYREELWPAEDTDLFLRLADVGTITNLPDPLLQYRVHPASIGHTHRNAQRTAHRRAVRDFLVRRGESSADLDSPAQSHHPEDGEHVGSCHDRWAWWALAGGHVRVARKHAWRNLRRNPIRFESWKLVACSLRGY